MEHAIIKTAATHVSIAISQAALWLSACSLLVVWKLFRCNSPIPWHIPEAHICICKLTLCCFLLLWPFGLCRGAAAAAPAGDASGPAEGAEVELFAPAAAAAAAAGNGHSKVYADAARMSDQGVVTGDYEVAVGGSPALLW
jgi:hypothetical protein